MEGMKGNVEFKDPVWHDWRCSHWGSQAQGKLVEIVLPEFQLNHSENTFCLHQPERQSHRLMHLMTSCKDGSIRNVVSGEDPCRDSL